MKIAIFDPLHKNVTLNKVFGILSNFFLLTPKN